MIKTFFTTLFGEVGSGRLNRMQFIGYTIGLSLLMFLVVFGTIFAVGTAERLMDGSMQDIQARLLERFGMLGMVGMMLLGILFAFASLNLTAKRVRDMGLPAWPVVLLMVAVGIVIGFLFPGEMVTVNGMQQMQPSVISATYQAIVFLALVLIPGNAFGNRQ